MEVALQWTESTDETIRSYVNGIRTSSGGTHESGFKAGIVKAIRNFMATHEVKTKGLTITAEDIREGMVGILSVFVREPLFQGQTKERLNNPEMTASVDGFVRPALEVVAQRQHDGRRPDRRPDRAGGQGPAGVARGGQRGQAQVGHAAAAQPARQAGRLQIDRTWTRRSCSSSKATRPAARPSRAATTGRRPCCRCAARSSTPRGWPLSKVLANAELNDLVSAIGTGAGDKFDLERPALRQDHPADGRRRGRLSHHDADAGVLLPPHAGADPQGPRLHRPAAAVLASRWARRRYWARDDAHKEEILAGLRANAKPEVVALQGPGRDGPAKVLAETTLDPRQRTLLRVEIESLLEADKRFVRAAGQGPGLPGQVHHGVVGAGGGGGAGRVTVESVLRSFAGTVASATMGAKGGSTMPLTVEAIYENGVLKPVRPLPLKEHEKVRITVEPERSWAERTAGMLQWTGDPEVLRRIAEDDEYGLLESP